MKAVGRNTQQLGIAPTAGHSPQPEIGGLSCHRHHLGWGASPPPVLGAQGQTPLFPSEVHAHTYLTDPAAGPWGSSVLKSQEQSS